MSCPQQCRENFPHLTPLPRGEGEMSAVGGESTSLWLDCHAPWPLPLLGRNVSTSWP